jgi:hypothetical protein
MRRAGSCSARGGRVPGRAEARRTGHGGGARRCIRGRRRRLTPRSDLKGDSSCRARARRRGRRCAVALGCGVLHRRRRSHQRFGHVNERDDEGLRGGVGDGRRAGVVGNRRRPVTDHH